MKLKCSVSRLPVFTAVSAFVLACLSVPASAAVQGVSAMTDDGNYGLTSVTIGGIEYTDLSGSAATVNVASSGTGYIAGWIANTTPALTRATIDAETSGLNYRAGAMNVLSGSSFQFGKVITETDQIFIFDFGSGDAMALQLINSSGEVVGNYSLSISAAAFDGPNLVLYSGIDTLLADNTTTLVPINNERAVAFQLSDFSGTIGDLSTATGIRLSSNSAIDPTIVGLASIPEPSAMGMGLLGLLIVAVVLRKRQR
ncbi:MAG: PEP-CTERM sorting domain-containing protein [Verrucomicrobiota bacterium JB024]|nr:PEP-CTERM sorting domain-containing protein [Verrucomicrobiota bacterium JB024]